MNMTKAMQQRSRAGNGSQEVFAANMLSSISTISHAQRRAVGHDNMNIRKARDRIFCDRHIALWNKTARIESILIVIVGKSPITELWLVR